MSDTLPPTPTTERPADPSTPGRRRPTAFIVVATVVVLALVAIGIALAASSGTDTPAASSTSSPSGSPAELVAFPPAAPADLEAKAKPFAVTLSWSPDTSEGEIFGYTVYRDGSEIGTVGTGGQLRYVDDEAAPLLRYEYAVAAFGKDDLASEPGEVRIKTPAASFGAARLEGTFNVRIDPVSSFGYTSTSRTTTGGWSFTPKCRIDACNVKVAQVFRGSAPVEMEQRFATYRVQGSGKLGVKCGGTQSTSTYTIEIHVEKAKTVDGIWHVVKFEGTFAHREAPQLGCVSAGADLRLTGTLVDL